MLPCHFFPARLLAPGVVAFILLILGCSSEPTAATGTPPDPRFALTVGATTIALIQGGAATTSIKATRSGGLTSPITYAIAGAPSGLTASITATTVADSVTLSVAASAALSPGAYPITINATASDAPAQQATIAVTVSSVVTGAPLVRNVTAGAHTCAITTTSAAYCWGYNANGQLGNNDTSIVNATPIPVTGGLLFAAIFASKVEGVTCGVTAPGTAYCWGDNDDGQLGDGTRTQRLTPTPVAGGLAFKSLSVGTVHTCGVAIDGTAYCWGFSTFGAFGDGSTGSHLTPVVAGQGMKLASIAAGNDFTCALTPVGKAYCWGRGLSGELGNGAATNSATPVAVSGDIDFFSLVAGGSFVCGLTTNGKAYCWGADFFGQLGDGSSATDDGMTRRTTPVEVAGGLLFRSLSAGYQTVCGVAASQTGYCWGYNDGAVGDGTLDHRSRPTPVAGGLTFQSIASGTAQSCGITTAGALYCWGSNSNGELGDGTTQPHSVPAPVRWPF